MKIGKPTESIEIWDAGLYSAKVTGVEETTSTFPGKEGTPRLKVVFLVLSEDGTETTEVWYWTNPTFSTHPKATFRPLIKALIPDLDVDAELEDPTWQFDTDEMKGKKARVILGIDEERGRNTIEKVMPATARRAAPAPAQAEDEEDEKGEDVPVRQPTRIPAGAGARGKVPF